MAIGKKQFQHNGFREPSDTKQFQILSASPGQWFTTLELQNLSMTSRAKNGRILLSLYRAEVVARETADDGHGYKFRVPVSK